MSIIAWLYAKGGFDLLLAAVTGIAAVFLVGVLGIVFLVSGVERARRVPQPAE